MEAPPSSSQPSFDYDRQIDEIADLFFPIDEQQGREQEEQEEEENENSQAGWTRLVEPVIPEPYRPPETGVIQNAYEERSEQGAVVNRGQTLLTELSAQTGVPLEPFSDFRLLAEEAAKEFEDFDPGQVVPEVTEPKQKKKRGPPRKRAAAAEETSDPLHQAPKPHKRTKIRAGGDDAAQTDVAIQFVWFARLARKGYRLPSSTAVLAQRVFHVGLLRQLKSQEETNEALAGARSWPPEPVLDWFNRVNRELEQELKALKNGSGVIQDLGEDYNRRKGIVTYLWRLFTLTSRRKIPSLGNEALVFLTKDYLESLIKAEDGRLLLVNELREDQLPEANELFARTAFSKICNANKIGGRLNALKLLEQRSKLSDDELASLLEEASVSSKKLSDQQNAKLDRIQAAAANTLELFRAITEFLIGEHYRNKVLPVFGRAVPLLAILDANKKILKAPGRPDYYTREGFLNGAIPWDPEWTLERWYHANDPKQNRLTVTAPAAAPAPPSNVSIETLPTLVNQQPQVTEALQSLLPSDVQPNAIAIAQLRQSVQIRDQTLLSATADIAPESRPGIVHSMEAAAAAAAAGSTKKRKAREEEAGKAGKKRESSSERIERQRRTDAQTLTTSVPGTEKEMAKMFYAFKPTRLQQALTNITFDPTPANHRGLGPFALLTVWQRVQQSATDIENAMDEFDQLWQSREATIVEDGDPNHFDAIRRYWRSVLEILISRKRKKNKRDELKKASSVLSPQPASAPPEQQPRPPIITNNEEQENPTTIQDNDDEAFNEPTSPINAEEGPIAPYFMLDDIPAPLTNEGQQPEDRVTMELIRSLMERLVEIRRSQADGSYEKGIKSYIDAVRRALLNKTPPPPVSAFCLTCPWRLFHDGVFDASQPMRLRDSNQYLFDTTLEYVGREEILSLLKHTNTRQYIAANAQRIYQCYYALHLLASRPTHFNDLENLIGFNVPLQRVFPTWHLQFVHYMQVACQTAQYDRDGVVSRLQPFRRLVLYPPVATLQVFITCRDQERVASGMFDASDFDALFGPDRRTLLVRVHDRVTSVTKNYRFQESRSQPKRLVLIDDLSFTTAPDASAILKIEYSLLGGLERVSLEPNASAVIQLYGQLDLDVLVSIAESDANTGILALRYSQLASCRTLPTTHELRQPISLQQNGRNSYAVSFNERFPIIATGTLTISERGAIKFTGAGTNADQEHPFFAHAMILPTGRNVPPTYPIDDMNSLAQQLVPSGSRRFALLLVPNHNSIVRAEKIDLYIYQLEQRELRLVNGNLPIPAIGLSLRSIVIYNQNGQFSQELSVHMQGNRHYAVRAPCMLLVTGQQIQSIIRDAIVLTNNENDLTTFPLTLEAPMGIADRALSISSSISSDTAPSGNGSSSNFKCDVCGSTKMIDARIYKGSGRSPQQADAAMRGQVVHYACGGTCSRRILTTVYQM